MSAAAQAAASPPPKTNQPDDEAIIAVNLSRIRAAQERYGSEGGSLRSTFAKAEQQGMNLAAAKTALKLVKSGKVDDYLAEIGAVTRYLRIMRHGISDSQLNLFTEDLSRAPVEEKATLDGRASGLNGEPEANNPHHGNTKAGMAWLTAHRQGFSERELILSMQPPEGSNDNTDAAEGEEADDTDGD